MAQLPALPDGRAASVTLDEIEGMPGIAYQNKTANELKFACRQEP